MNSDDLIQISQDDDTLLLNDSVSLDFSCSPLLTSIPNGNDTWQTREKESVNKLSVKMKSNKKKKGFNLRKSLAWNHAFFTDEGVLDPTELSMLSEGMGSAGGEMLSVIDEGRESLSGDMEGDSNELQAVDDNVLKELPSSSMKKGQKTSSNVVSTSVPGSCGKEKKLSSPSVVKRKVLSAHDINRSASKRSGGPLLSVPSSSLRRPSNLNTAKAVRKEPNVSKVSTVKPDQLVNSAACRSSKTSVNPPKCKQKALPAINSKKNIAKATFTNTKSSSSNVRSGPAVKSILKSSIRPARNVVKPVSSASTNVHNIKVNATNIDVKSDSAVSVSARLLDDHDGNTGRISVSFGANMRQAQPQPAKPSGLRMPSPSLSFFDQAKPGSSQGLPQKRTQLVRPTESGVCASKVGGPRPPLPSPSLSFFDQAKPGSSQGLPQKRTQLVRPTESGVCASKVGGPKPPLPPRKIPAMLDSESSIVPTIELNSLEKLKSNLKVNDIQKVGTSSPLKCQTFDEKMYERQVNDVDENVCPQSPDVEKLSEPCKIEGKDAENSEFLFQGTACEQLKKDNAREAFSGSQVNCTELVLHETGNSNLTRHINDSTEVKGLLDTKSMSCDEISLDTQSNGMNNFSYNLSDKLDYMEEQSQEHGKLTDTGSHGVHLLSSMNIPILEISGLPETECLNHSQICEDTQSIEMDICSDRSTSEVCEDLPGETHGMSDQFDELAKLMETDCHAVRPISITNSPLVLVNDDILLENATHEVLSACKSLDVADFSVQAEVCTPSKVEFSCSLSHCKDVEHRKDETAEIDNLSCEVQQDVEDLCGDDNQVNGGDKNTLSTADADHPHSMIMDNLGEKELKEDEFPNLCAIEEANCGDQDTDSCEAAKCVMLRDTDPCESELKKMNDHSVITDALSGMYAEYGCSNTFVVTEEENDLPFGDQQDNNACCVKSVSSEETDTDKNELKDCSILGSTPLFDKDYGVDVNGEVSLHGDNPLATYQPVLVVDSYYEENTLGEQEIDSSVLLNVCSTDSEMGNEIRQSLEQDKMITTDCFHDTEQNNRKEDSQGGLLFDNARSVEDSRKDENVMILETIAAGSAGSVVPHVFCQVQRTEEASQLTVIDTPMENSQLSHDLVDRCNANISDSTESTDYLVAPDNIHGQPEEQSVLERPDHMTGQIYEESYELSSDNYLLPSEISTGEEDISGGNGNVLEHSNNCSNEVETLNICSLETPAMQGSALEVERKTESMDGMMVSGSLEVESSVENVDLIMAGECNADEKHRSHEPLEFVSPMNNDCANPSSGNCNADGVDNDTACTDIMQGIEDDLLDSKTLAVVDEIHVAEESTHQSDLQYEMGNSTKDKNVTASYKESANEKRNAAVIKPSPNAVPFSDEWLAAIEAAGEEILTMKSGAVQNSPPDKSQPEPSPWSPVKRKNNQGIGPYDCTKYGNTGIPPSTSS